MVAGRCFEHACRGRLTVGYPTSGRDFFSTHFDINYLPENQARTEALWETSKNGGHAACDGGRRVTFVARFCWSRATVFSRGERVETRTLLCRSVEGQILSVSDMAIFQYLSACGALPKVKTFQRTHFLRDRERGVAKTY